MDETTPQPADVSRPPKPLQEPKRLLAENLAIVALTTGTVFVLVAATTTTTCGAGTSRVTQWQERRNEAAQAVREQQAAEPQQSPGSL